MVQKLFFPETLRLFIPDSQSKAQSGSQDIAHDVRTTRGGESRCNVIARIEKDAASQKQNFNNKL